MTYIFPIRQQSVSATEHDQVAVAAGEWAQENRAFQIDAARDRIQIRMNSNGGVDLSGAISAVDEWMEERRALGKSAFAINEWPEVFELRIRIEGVLRVSGYRAEPFGRGDFKMYGVNDVPIGRIAPTPQGWVARQETVIPGGTPIVTPAHIDAQAAFEHFLKLGGFVVS